MAKLPPPLSKRLVDQLVAFSKKNSKTTSSTGYLALGITVKPKIGPKSKRLQVQARVKRAAA
jgi:hypothetical protein